MNDLELKCVYQGVEKPLHLYWDYEIFDDTEIIGVIIERKEKRDGRVYSDFRNGNNSAWISTPKIIQTKDYSLTIPEYWSIITAAERAIRIHLIGTNQNKHSIEITIGE